MATDRTATPKAATTARQQVSVQLTAAEAGGSPSVAVYARDLGASGWFRADDLSLTSP